MPGTKIGGQRAAATNKKRYGKGFYNRIGKLGGETSRGGGFKSEIVDKNGLTGSERARLAGQKGGLKSAEVRWGYKKDV